MPFIEMLDSPSKNHTSEVWVFMFDGKYNMREAFFSRTSVHIITGKVLDLCHYCNLYAIDFTRNLRKWDTSQQILTFVYTRFRFGWNKQYAGSLFAFWDAWFRVKTDMWEESTLPEHCVLSVPDSKTSHFVAGHFFSSYAGPAREHCWPSNSCSWQ